jgi:hypothetical protein
MQIPWDEVTFPLTIEHGIVSDTVRVGVRATLSIAGADAVRVRSMVGEVLGTLLDGEWQFSAVEREEDKSGMEQVVTLATIRVPEHRTGGLVERIARASKPGLKLALVSISARPPKQEIDRARAEVRRQVYERAKEEEARLNQVYAPATPNEGWRVGSISIKEQLVEPSTSRGRSQRATREHLSYGSTSLPEPAEDEYGPDFQVSTRLVVEASVRLKRPSVAPPSGGFFGA